LKDFYVTDPDVGIHWCLQVTQEQLDRKDELMRADPKLRIWHAIMQATDEIPYPDQDSQETS
jgi:hypothetical protein